VFYAGVGGVGDGSGAGATWASTSAFTAGAGAIDPVALYLPFAGNFNDQSSAALTPTVFGNAYVTNRQGVFDGDGDYVTFPEAALVITGDFTIELWANFADLSDRSIMSGTSSPDSNVQLFRASGGTLGVYMNNAGQYIANAASGIVVNNWYHLAFCRSGNSTRLFVNGAQIGATFTGWTAGFSCNAIGQHFFNGNPVGNPGNFSGRLRDLRVTRQALYTSNFTPAAGANWSSGSAFVTGDDQFSSVSLLLPFDGANGSTTFTDSSSNALVPSSVVGSVAISTAQSKYGGASALFPSSGGNAYIRYTPQEALQFTGDFTIELWVLQFAYEDQITASSQADNNTQVFRLNESGYSGALSFYLNGTQVFGPTAAGIGLNTWHHLAICRSGTNTRMFVDGVQKGATNTTWTGSFRMDIIGLFFFNGNVFFASSAYQFRGHIDDSRVTKAARYTANFTPPTAPFPNS
jgi:hypothetical protein